MELCRAKPRGPRQLSAAPSCTQSAGAPPRGGLSGNKVTQPLQVTYPVLSSGPPQAAQKCQQFWGCLRVLPLSRTGLLLRHGVLGAPLSPGLSGFPDTCHCGPCVSTEQQTFELEVPVASRCSLDEGQLRAKVTLDDVGPGKCWAVTLKGPLCSLGPGVPLKRR